MSFWSRTSTLPGWDARRGAQWIARLSTSAATPQTARQSTCPKGWSEIGRLDAPTACMGTSPCCASGAFPHPDCTPMRSPKKTLNRLFVVPRAGVEPARPFSGKRRILSPQCLPISPSGRRLRNAHLRRSVTRAARTRNAPVESDEGNASRHVTITKKKRKPKLPLHIWSGKRVSNSRPQPWQGCALPTELFPHLPLHSVVTFSAHQQVLNYSVIFEPFEELRAFFKEMFSISP